MLEKITQQLFELMTVEANLIAILLLFSNLLWIKIWYIERSDRQAAWKNNNEFKTEVVNAMKDIIPLLAIIKDRSDRV